MDERQVVAIDFGDERHVLVEARVDADPEQDVGVGDLLKFDRVADTLEQITSSLQGAIARAKPSKATIEFGVDVGIESGQLTSMLVKGTGSATLKITVEWASGS
jgi:Trypsin-co-occurring domain 1